MTPFQIGGCHVYISGEQCREWRKSCLPPFFSDHPCQGGWACAHPLCQVDIVYFLKHCQRHNGPRLLSLKLELSLQVKYLNSSFNTFSLPPCLRARDRLFLLVHLPVILLVHHHLNKHQLPAGSTTHIVANMITNTSSNIPCNSCTT